MCTPAGPLATVPAYALANGYPPLSDHAAGHPGPVPHSAGRQVTRSRRPDDSISTEKGSERKKAREILDRLKFDYNVNYDEKDSIGKRYRRQDAIGTPFCITVDYQSLEDNTVTLRHRDSMEQERVAITDLERIISDLVSWKNLFAKL